MTVRNSTSMRRLLPLPYSERRIKITRTYYEHRPKKSVAHIYPATGSVDLDEGPLVGAGRLDSHSPKIRVMRGCLVVTVRDDEQ